MGLPGVSTDAKAIAADIHQIIMGKKDLRWLSARHAEQFIS